MTEQNIDNNVADAADIAAATAATEEFTNTIGDSLATDTEAEVETAAPAIHEGPIQTVGRRKRAIARVRLVAGSGNISVNGRAFDEYFPNKLHQQDTGGGPTGQAGALRLAIARALNIYNPADRQALKKAGLLTRDARAVERKKAGLHKARRAPQYSKR